MAVRKPAKKRSRLLLLWSRLRAVLDRGDPRRVFVGKLVKENSKIIQTAKTAPRHQQKVKRRQRVLMARKKRIARAALSAVKLVLFGAALAVLVVHVLGYLHSSPRFSIAHIGVNGNAHATAHAVIQKSGIVEGENIFRFSLADSKAAIEEIPRVRHARVERKLPDEIYIEITERRPLALLLSRDLLCVDEEGEIFAKFHSSEKIDAPIITGRALAGLRVGDTVKAEGIAEALEIIRIMNEMDVQQNIRISEINIDDPANILMVEQRSGANILIGSGDLRGKLWRLARVAETINRDKRLQIANLEGMDMRFEAIVPAKFKDS
jgi:cell division protein FtsQ